MRSPWANPTDSYPWKDDPMDFEQTEHEAIEAIESYKQPPDEPYPPLAAGDPYAEARQYLLDAAEALTDPDPEDALRCAREAIARIESVL